MHMHIILIIIFIVLTLLNMLHMYIHLNIDTFRCVFLFCFIFSVFVCYHLRIITSITKFNINIIVCTHLLLGRRNKKKNIRVFFCHKLLNVKYIYFFLCGTDVLNMHCNSCINANCWLLCVNSLFFISFFLSKMFSCFFFHIF